MICRVENLDIVLTDRHASFKGAKLQDWTDVHPPMGELGRFKLD